MIKATLVQKRKLFSLLFLVLVTAAANASDNTAAKPPWISKKFQNLVSTENIHSVWKFLSKGRQRFLNFVCGLHAFQLHSSFANPGPFGFIPIAKFIFTFNGDKPMKAQNEFKNLCRPFDKTFNGMNIFGGDKVWNFSNHGRFRRCVIRRICRGCYQHQESKENNFLFWTSVALIITTNVLYTKFCKAGATPTGLNQRKH